MEENYGDLIDIMVDIFGEYRSHSDYRGQISFDCPVCSHDIKSLEHGDGKGNLELNYLQGVYKCWVCSETHGTHGTILKIIKKYGSKSDYNKFKLYLPDDFIPKEKNIEKVRLPKEFRKLSEVSEFFKKTPVYFQVKHYLDKRGITDFHLQIYGIGFCHEGDYSGRLIIPSFDEEGEVNYFVARSYTDKHKFKYKNPEVDKETIIWNESLIDWDETVYIVEGVLDSIFLPNSIPMLGKKMTDKLFYKLYDNAKKVVIILDPDARREQNNLYHRLNCGKLMGKIRTIELGNDLDVADIKGDISKYEEKIID